MIREGGGSAKEDLRTSIEERSADKLAMSLIARHLSKAAITRFVSVKGREGWQGAVVCACEVSTVGKKDVAARTYAVLSHHRPK